MLSQIYEISFLSTLSIMHMLEPGHYSTMCPVGGHLSQRTTVHHNRHDPGPTRIGGGRHDGEGGGAGATAAWAAVASATMARAALARAAPAWTAVAWTAMATAATATAPLLLPLPLAPLLLPLLLLQLRMLSAQASKVRGGQNHHTAAINARCRRVPPALGPATIRRVRSTRWSRLGVRSMRWSRPCKALLAKSPPTSLPPMPSQPVSTTPPSPTPPAAAAPPK